MHPNFLVETVPPFRILAVIDDCVSRLLGYNVCELKGQNASKLLGTDLIPAMFLSAIQATADLQASKIQFTIKGKNNEVKMIVSFAPYLDGLARICQMTFQPSQAISLQEVFEESDCPHALISTEPPYYIHMANELFSIKFGLSKPQVLGHPLHFIQNGPDAAKWSMLLASALDGRIARDRLSTLISPNFEDTILVPVVEGPNGCIKHILVAFPPPPFGRVRARPSP